MAGILYPLSFSAKPTTACMDTHMIPAIIRIDIKVHKFYPPYSHDNTTIPKNKNPATRKPSTPSRLSSFPLPVIVSG
jgi:hypothetical protein